MRAPLFILAPPRSFTSLVNAMLGQHPQMYGLPELNLFLADTLAELWLGEEDESGERRPALSFGPMMRHGLLRTVAQLYAGEQSIEAVNMARNWVRVRQRHRTTDVYRELAAKIAPLIPVDKSPAYASKLEHMERIIEAFPEARFIQLFRHPRGQCNSVMKVAGGAMARLMDSWDHSGPRPILDPQIAWHDFHMNILEFLDQVPRGQYLQLRGEELFHDTAGTLRRVVQWLGLRDDATAVAAMQHPEDSPYACMGPVNAMLGNDHNFLKNPVFRPTQLKQENLTDPLPWRPDGKGFMPEVIELARSVGYT